MRLIKKIKSLFNKLFKNGLKVSFTDDIPNVLNKNRLYVIGRHNHYWLIIFKCPCGCKGAIYLNLLKEEKPNWDFEVIKDKITIIPSIKTIKECQSHFWIRNNKIIWCR